MQAIFREIREGKARSPLKFVDQYRAGKLNPLGGCSQGAFALHLNV